MAETKPDAILRHAFGIYWPVAMLAGMQLDVFTPLKDGPMGAEALAAALQVRAERLRPLLYALVRAGLLTVAGERFANTAEADRYLVRGRPTYMGGMHELYADIWSAALQAGASIRSGVPQKKHDFAADSPEQMAAFFRGLHPGALATGRQLATGYGFDRFRHLLDVGGGSGGVAIAACRLCPALEATVAELPSVTPITRRFIDEAGLAGRVQVIDADVVAEMSAHGFDVAVMRALIQVLGREQAARALRHVGAALAPGGALFIIGHVLEDSRLAPDAAVGMNIAFLSVFDEGQAYTEAEHRRWLADAGFAEAEVHYGAASGGQSIVVARKAG